jgi:hypothetical protein
MTTVSGVASEEFDHPDKLEDHGEKSELVARAQDAMDGLKAREANEVLGQN